MKKLMTVLLVLTMMVLTGLLVISRLVQGSHLIGNEAMEMGGRPILEDQYLDTEVIVMNQEVYMALEGVNQYIHQEVSIDKDNQKLLLTPKEDGFYFENELLDRQVKEAPLALNFVLEEIDGQLYVPIKSLESLLGIKVSQGESSGIVMIDWADGSYSQGEITKKAYLLESPGILGKRKLTLTEGAAVTLYDSVEDYYHVRTEEGYLGYIRKDRLQEKEPVSEPDSLTFSIKHQPGFQGKIGLVWDYVGRYTKDRRQEEKLAAVDVLSLTWFRLTDEKGNLENKGDFTYMENARQKGYQVWGLVTNSFDPDLTSAFLANDSAQDNFIRHLLFYSGLYGLDGINIDFENIHYQDQRALTAFVARLTEVLHQNNLIVSIDVTVPSNSLNWSMVFDRQALAEIVDYVAVMTYDEHWASSPKSGSVASIGWVERGLKRTLESIPAEKLLLGLPFYTRLWEEEPLAGGGVRVSSKAYGMEQINQILLENEASVQWNQETGQYYGEYSADGKQYRVWLEESRSLALKTSLVNQYNLAGAAAWRKDFEVEAVWETINSVLKQGQDYESVAARLPLP